MGIYSEYLDKKWGMPQLTAERKAQLNRISALRGGRDVLVFASDLNKNAANIIINYSDLLPINDQLSNCKGGAIDLILETPGGSGEIAEDIVRLLRSKYEHLGIIVPGWAKSAGCLIAMAGDEILMEAVSALGPIDAQLSWQGKVFSADALLEGMDKIKKEVTNSGVLNKAYIPILQGISPGELQSAENALRFAEELVGQWLENYKFRNWVRRETSGTVVTPEDRRAKAKEIAQKLRSQQRWLTHGRSIKMEDLLALGVKVTNYAAQPDLADAIRRYYTLLQLTFASPIYKVFETPISQIYRYQRPQGGTIPLMNAAQADKAMLDIQCNACHAISKVQANFDRPRPLEQGAIAFPASNKLQCPRCQAEIDLSELRKELELQVKKPLVFEVLS